MSEAATAQGAPGPSDGAVAREAQTRALGRRAVNAFFAGQLEELGGMLGEELAEDMDPEALAEFHRHIAQTYGALAHVIEQQVFERDGAMVYAASVATVQSDEPVLFVTVWNSAWRITDIRIMPHPRFGAK